MVKKQATIGLGRCSVVNSTCSAVLRTSVHIPIVTQQSCKHSLQKTATPAFGGEPSQEDHWGRNTGFQPSLAMKPQVQKENLP